VAVPVIVGIVILRSRYGDKSKAADPDKYNVNIISRKIKEVGIAPLTAIMEKQTEGVSLKHMSEDGESVSLLFDADFRGINAVDNLRKALTEFEDQIAVDIVQNREFS
jgi:5S rRNA maturation endonuclease (ribonuclease M5)